MNEISQGAWLPVDAEWLEVAAKLVVYVGTLMAIGSVGLHRLVLPRSRGIVTEAPRIVWEAWADRVFALAAYVVLAGLAFRVWTHTVAVFGFTEAWSWQNLATIGFQSRWGQSWRVQSAAALMLLLAARWTRSYGLAGRLVGAVVVVVLCGVLPLTGHAAGQPLRIAVHGSHLLAGGLWLGTLALLVAGRSPRLRAAQAQLLRAFAPIAVTGATVLIVSGAIAAWMYLGSLSNLWLSGYGRLLALKVVLVAAVLACGGLNWRWLHWRAETEANHRYLFIEVGLAVVVLFLTAWLTEIAHPM